jgi:hypothetical protein
MRGSGDFKNVADNPLNRTAKVVIYSPELHHALQFVPTDTGKMLSRACNNQTIKGLGGPDGLLEQAVDPAAAQAVGNLIEEAPSRCFDLTAEIQRETVATSGVTPFGKAWQPPFCIARLGGNGRRSSSLSKRHGRSLCGLNTRISGKKAPRPEFSSKPKAIPSKCR